MSQAAADATDAQQGDVHAGVDGTVAANHDASSDEDQDEQPAKKEKEIYAEKAHSPKTAPSKPPVSATTAGSAPGKEGDAKQQKRKRRVPRPLTQEEVMHNLESGWSLAPLHQFERTLLAPGGKTVALSPRSAVGSPRGGPTSAVLPAIPSPPARGSPRGRSSVPSSELMEARQYAQMWLKETSAPPSSSRSARGDNKSGGGPAATTSSNAEAELVAPPVWASLAMQLPRRNSLSPTRDNFAVPPRDGNFLFEKKQGYDPVPAYMERIAMSNKLKSVPFHLHASPSPSYGHASSRPSTRDEMSSRRSARGHHLPGPA